MFDVNGPLVTLLGAATRFFENIGWAGVLCFVIAGVMIYEGWFAKRDSFPNE